MQKRLAHLLQRYNSAATWSSVNPILLEGEIGIESDTNKAKLGDGTTRWNSLSYFINGGAETNYQAGDGVDLSYDGVLSATLQYIEVGLTQLSAPTNISITGTTVTFDGVANATQYEFLVDGNSIGTYG